jgi:hypothetical protein
LGGVRRFHLSVSASSLESSIAVQFPVSRFKPNKSFETQNPCPSTGKSSGSCPGYVVDHRKALAEGGADEPSNMQWQTTADAKAKDKWERKP